MTNYEIEEAIFAARKQPEAKKLVEIIQFLQQVEDNLAALSNQFQEELANAKDNLYSVRESRDAYMKIAEARLERIKELEMRDE